MRKNQRVHVYHEGVFVFEAAGGDLSHAKRGKPIQFASVMVHIFKEMLELFATLHNLNRHTNREIEMILLLLLLLLFEFD